MGLEIIDRGRISLDDAIESADFASSSIDSSTTRMPRRLPRRRAGLIVGGENIEQTVVRQRVSLTLQSRCRETVGLLVSPGARYSGVLLSQSAQHQQIFLRQPADASFAGVPLGLARPIRVVQA